MRVLFLRTKTLICCNKRNHEFIFYTLRKTVKIRRRRLTDSVVMTRKEGYDQLVMSRNSSRIKASRKTQGRLLLSYKNPDFFSGLSELYRIFQKWRSLWGLFICCTEDHTCTVVNNGTCAVLSAHTANWRQKFSSSQLVYYLWTGVTSSSCRRTRYS